MKLSVVYSDSSVVTLAPKSTFKWVGYRFLHNGEPGFPLDEYTPSSMPEVREAKDAAAIPFTKDMQLLSWNLMRRFNPSISKSQWRGVFKEKIALTNTAGFEGDEPRADFVNGYNLKAELPRLQKAIRCGGSFTSGTVAGSMLLCIPGLDGIDVSKGMPTVDEVIARGWYFYAVTASYVKGIWRIFNFPQGNMGPVVIPAFLSEAVEYRLDMFGKWEADVLPDPLRMY